MAIGIRKVWKGLKHFDFIWDITPGAVNVAPDWKPTRVCGKGLHFCKPGDDIGYLEGHYVVVVEYDESTAIDLDGKHKAESLKVLWSGEPGDDGYKRFIDPADYVTDSESEWAYLWASYIGDREHLRQFVTDSESAYCWAIDIGDQDHMRQFVTDSEWAYLWARDIGDEEHMRQFVTEPKWACFWALHLGDEEHMRQFIK